MSETVALPGLPGHTITLATEGSWVTCEIVNDADPTRRYSAGWRVDADPPGV